jgi:hypothetical protein
MSERGLIIKAKQLAPGFEKAVCAEVRAAAGPAIHSPAKFPSAAEEVSAP